MTMVYSHANSVLVSLGEEADGSSELFDILVETAVSENSMPVPVVTVPEKAIAALLQRHWFHRIWVSYKKLLLPGTSSSLAAPWKSPVTCSAKACRRWPWKAPRLT
jgi:hypothetical protein